MRTASITLFACGLVFAASEAGAACGCTGMSVARTTGSTQIICSSRDFGDFKECTKRSGGTRTVCTSTYEYACPVGVNSKKWGASKPEQKTGFGVTATLTGTSSQCTSGQLLALTITGDGKTEQNPPINPTNSTGGTGALVAGVTFDVDNDPTHAFPAYPNGGGTATNPKFGGDNYRWADNAKVLIEREDGLFRWWDNTDQGKAKKSEDASWRYKFVSWVKGSSGQPSCACSFDISVDWGPGANPNTTYTQEAAYSSNCNW
ncbi:hypothetical protein NYQ83_06635 [Afifella sp. JA880]|uniref:hypothetical protein n=1 Tax=Afifella sp. JA880 TaxID=2975280 RepID=UPI0021BB816A|nr:hypothetical protein [Afifella sp. JA880]MCT8266945.1 hypothetical protein [Afifella sp. JA880]